MSVNLLVVGRGQRENLEVNLSELRHITLKRLSKQDRHSSFEGLRNTDQLAYKFYVKCFSIDVLCLQKGTSYGNVFGSCKVDFKQRHSGIQSNMGSGTYVSVSGQSLLHNFTCLNTSHSYCVGIKIICLLLYLLRNSTTLSHRIYRTF